MTVLEAAAAPANVDFVARCKYFAVKAAVAVANEAQTTALHQDRIALARKILLDPEGWGGRFALGAVTNSTLFAAASLAAITDGDLEFTINSLYSAYL